MALFNIPGVTTPKTTAPTATKNTFGFTAPQPTAPPKAVTPVQPVNPLASPALAPMINVKPATQPVNPITTPSPTQPPGIQPLTTASLTQMQKEALARIGQGTGQVDPTIAATLGKATSAVDRLTTPYDPNSYQQFMNPYLDEVIKRNAGNITRNYDIQRNRINEDMAAAGGFGSSAQGVERALTNEAESRQIGDMDAQLRAQGFDTATGRALDLYGTGLNTANTAASQYQNIAGGYQNLDSYTKQKIANDLQQKLAAGGQIQGQNQKELDAYFAERDRQFNYPYVNADFLGNILSRYPTGQTTTAVTPGVGAIQGGLGGALLGSAIANSSPSYGTYQTQGALPWQTPGATYPTYRY